MGGIGTGTVSLGGRGDLRDWELVNRTAQGFSPDFTFLALTVKPAGEKAVTKVLEGPNEPPFDSISDFLAFSQPHDGVAEWRLLC